MINPGCALFPQYNISRQIILHTYIPILKGKSVFNLKANGNIKFMHYIYVRWCLRKILAYRTLRIYVANTVTWIFMHYSFKFNFWWLFYFENNAKKGYSICWITFNGKKLPCLLRLQVGSSYFTFFSYS